MLIIIITNNFLLQKEIDKLKKEVKKEKENNSKIKRMLL